MNKVIFLDVDGVMTSVRTGWHNWDIYAVSFLKWACEMSGTKIVISSTWRYNRNRDFFEAIFPNLIHDDWKTPNDLSNFDIKCRGDEIKIWLDRHPEVDTYVILDDDDDMLGDQPLIQTDYHNGIMYGDMEKLRLCLGLGHAAFNMDANTIHFHPNMFRQPEKLIKTLNIRFT